MATELRSLVVTFEPHPRTVRGNRVELLTTTERRLELLEQTGIDDVLLLHFDSELSLLTPEAFADSILRASGVQVVVEGDGFRFGRRRSGDLDLLVPRNGIYAGSALGHRVAVSIGTNPHYGGTERRVEAFLLDFHGDLYGRPLVLELWERLRDEAAFGSEQELIAAIAGDVERTRAAVRPV